MELLPVDSSFRSEASAPPRVCAPESRLELAQSWMEMGALAVNCRGQLQAASGARFAVRPTLVSIAETVRTLGEARQLARSLGVGVHLLACTEARNAAALEDDRDPRDRKFLSGAKTRSGAHVYCGGLDAAISRALVFAQYAEAVCFKTQSTDFAEASRFAQAVRSSFPGKKLGFSHLPGLDGVRWNLADHRAIEARLRQIGYDFYFVTQFGSPAFPHAPFQGDWVLFGDAARCDAEEAEIPLVMAPSIARAHFRDASWPARRTGSSRHPAEAREGGPRHSVVASA